MDRTWIHLTNKWGPEYEDGVAEFIRVARCHTDQSNRIRCPCRNCVNVLFLPVNVVKEHLYQHGMLEDYTRWVFHGEPYQLSADEVVVEHVSIDGDRDERIETHDDMGGLIRDLQAGEFSSNFGDGTSASEPPLTEGEEIDKFARLLKEAQSEAYPGCQKFSKLSLVIRLLHMKTIGKWSNKSVNMVLDLIRELVPPGHTLPKSFHEAQSLLRELGLGYIKIDVCPNNCALYWKENEHLDHCPNPDCNEPRWKSCKGKRKKIPRKVLRYFPLKPRLQKLFMSKSIAKDMRWHKEKRVQNSNVIGHPADAKQWHDFDKEHEWFAQDSRNVRLGLASDGFNPFGNMSNSYSMWPVVVMPYNLPPWKCMKEEFMMMPLLIPGPQSPGNDIDVMFRPFIDECKELWYDGVETFDAYSGERFKLHAAIMGTINDFPAYGMLSGWSTKGKLACPPCNRETHSIRLEKSKKQAYMGARRFLEKNHKFRRSRRFNGKYEFQTKPRELSGDDVLEQLKSLPNDLRFGKTSANKKRKRGSEELNWRKKSIFFELPYWRSLKVRHNLDVMHIEKNICESLVGTLMNIDGKTKDNANSRSDLEHLGIRKELHLQKDGDRLKMPPAPYNLDANGRKRMCDWLKLIKFPDGYASNISRCVSVRDNKIIGMKSHDYHVLLQRLLPLAIRGSLSKEVCEAITELSLFFKELSSRTLTVESLERLEHDIVLILCKLELIFPPSFFDVMMHLPLHLPREAMYGGPVQFRWMYPIERFLRTLKQYVRNKARPEGSIAEAYIDNECLNFCSMYLSGVETRFNREERNHGVDNIREKAQFSVFSRGARPLGARSEAMLDPTDYEKISWFILHNCEEIDPYLRKHRVEIEMRHSTNVEQTHQNEFAEWFKYYIAQKCIENDAETSTELYSLACGPDKRIVRYKGCVINGMRFHTIEHDQHRTTQNSGVVVRADHEGKEIDFYGVLTDIIELSYLGGNRVLIFKCDWFNLGDKKTGIRKDNHFTSINVTRTWYERDPYILASQAQQVFYVPDVILGNNYRIVQKIQPRNTYNIQDSDDICNDRDDNGIFEEDAYQQSVTNRIDEMFEVDVQSTDLLNHGDVDPPAANTNARHVEESVEDYSSNDDMADESDNEYQSSEGDGSDDDDYDTDLDDLS